MKTLFYEVRHFSPNFHEFTVSKTIFAKKNSLKAFFSPKIGEKENFFKIRFKLLYVRLKKKKNKSHWCREGKTLEVRPLRKNTFLIFFNVCLP